MRFDYSSHPLISDETSLYQSVRLSFFSFLIKQVPFKKNTSRLWIGCNDDEDAKVLREISSNNKLKLTNQTDRFLNRDSYEGSILSFKRT